MRTCETCFVIFYSTCRILRSRWPKRPCHLTLLAFHMQDVSQIDECGWTRTYCMVQNSSHGPLLKLLLGPCRVLEPFLLIKIGLKRSKNNLKWPSWSLVMAWWKCMEFYRILRRLIRWDKQIMVQFLARMEFFRYDPDRIKLRKYFYQILSCFPQLVDIVLEQNIKSRGLQNSAPPKMAHYYAPYSRGQACIDKSCIAIELIFACDWQLQSWILLGFPRCFWWIKCSVGPFML